MIFSEPLIPGKLYYLTTNSEYSCPVYEYPERNYMKVVGVIGLLDKFVYLGTSPQRLELVLLTDGTFGWMDAWWKYHHFSEVVTEE